MEKGIVVLIFTGVLGVWLYLSFSQTHDANRAESVSRHVLDAAEFDKDFDEARGVHKAENDQKVLQAKSDLAAAKSESVKINNDQKQKISNLQSSTETEMKNEGVDVSKIQQQLEKAAEGKK